MALSRLATAKQIILLALAWALVLCAADFVANPRPLAAVLGVLRGERAAAALPAPAPSTPRVALLMNHMCCSGCLNDLRQALRELPWVGSVHRVKEAPPEEDESHEGAEREGAWVNLESLDVERIDFVDLDRAVRGMGLAPERIVLDGLRHFRLEAEVKHICCPGCATALDQGLDRLKGLPTASGLRWIDSVVVSKEKGLVTVFARYGHAVDVTELLAAFNHVGFAPRALRVLSGDEA